MIVGVLRTGDELVGGIVGVIQKGEDGDENGG
jgi:hypothetical protein